MPWPPLDTAEFVSYVLNDLVVAAVSELKVVYDGRLSEYRMNCEFQTSYIFSAATAMYFHWLDEILSRQPDYFREFNSLEEFCKAIRVDIWRLSLEARIDDLPTCHKIAFEEFVREEKAPDAIADFYGWTSSQFGEYLVEATDLLAEV